jgi:hypothetical protein
LVALARFGLGLAFLVVKALPRPLVEPLGTATSPLRPWRLTMSEVMPAVSEAGLV